MSMNDLPVISIVTPSFNSEDFLEETIDSVLSQNYPNLEYYVIDGGSTDTSIEIIKKYANHLSGWVSEPDNGMYHALNKGFSLTTGEIMTWLNSDDLMIPGALAITADVFNQLPSVEWLLGLPCNFDLQGRLISICAQPPRWSKYRFLMGDFKWIQQEGSFWRRSLWKKAGSELNKKYRYAGDLELWSRFFQHAELHSLNIPLAGMRIRGKGQLSYDHWHDYSAEANEIIKLMQNSPDLSNSRQRCQLIQKRQNTLTWLSKLKIFNSTAFFKYFIEPTFEYPHKISYRHQTKKFDFDSN